jgi:hypothetical protein
MMLPVLADRMPGVISIVREAGLSNPREKEHAKGRN